MITEKKTSTMSTVQATLDKFRVHLQDKAGKVDEAKETRDKSEAKETRDNSEATAAELPEKWPRRIAGRLR